MYRTEYKFDKTYVELISALPLERVVWQYAYPSEEQFIAALARLPDYKLAQIFVEHMLCGRLAPAALYSEANIKRYSRFLINLYHRPLNAKLRVGPKEHNISLTFSQFKILHDFWSREPEGYVLPMCRSPPEYWYFNRMQWFPTVSPPLDMSSIASEFTNLDRLVAPLQSDINFGIPTYHRERPQPGAWFYKNAAVAGPRNIVGFPLRYQDFIFNKDMFTAWPAYWSDIRMNRPRSPLGFVVQKAVDHVVRFVRHGEVSFISSEYYYTEVKTQKCKSYQGQEFEQVSPVSTLIADSKEIKKASLKKTKLPFTKCPTLNCCPRYSKLGDSFNFQQLDWTTALLKYPLMKPKDFEGIDLKELEARLVGLEFSLPIRESFEIDEGDLAMFEVDEEPNLALIEAGVLENVYDFEEILSQTFDNTLASLEEGDPLVPVVFEKDTHWRSRSPAPFPRAPFNNMCWLFHHCGFMATFDEYQASVGKCPSPASFSVLHPFPDSPGLIAASLETGLVSLLLTDLSKTRLPPKPPYDSIEFPNLVDLKDFDSFQLIEGTFSESCSKVIRMNNCSVAHCAEQIPHVDLLVLDREPFDTDDPDERNDMEYPFSKVRQWIDLLKSYKPIIKAFQVQGGTLILKVAQIVLKESAAVLQEILTPYSFIKFLRSPYQTTLTESWYVIATDFKYLSVEPEFRSPSPCLVTALYNMNTYVYYLLVRKQLLRYLRYGTLYLRDRLLNCRKHLVRLKSVFRESVPENSPTTKDIREQLGIEDELLPVDPYAAFMPILDYNDRGVSLSPCSSAELSALICSHKACDLLHVFKDIIQARRATNDPTD